MEQTFVVIVFILSCVKLGGIIGIYKILWNVSRTENKSTLSFITSPLLLFFARTACVMLWLTITYQFYFILQRCFSRDINTISIYYNLAIAILTIQIIGMFSLTRLLFFHKSFADGSKQVDMSSLELSLVKASCVAAVIPSFYVMGRILMFTLKDDKQDRQQFIRTISPTPLFKMMKEKDKSKVNVPIIHGIDLTLQSGDMKDNIIDIIHEDSKELTIIDVDDGGFLNRLRNHPSEQEANTSKYIWESLLTKYIEIFPTKKNGLKENDIEKFNQDKLQNIYLSFFINPVLKYFQITKEDGEEIAEGWPLLYMPPSDEIISTILESLKDLRMHKELDAIMERLYFIASKDPEINQFIPLWERAKSA